MNDLKDIIDFSLYQKRLDIIISARNEEYKLDVQDILYNFEKLFRKYKKLDHLNYYFKSRSDQINVHFFEKPYFMKGNIIFNFFDKNGEQLDYDENMHKSFEYDLRMLRKHYEIRNTINIFNKKGSRNNRFKLYQTISDKYELPETFMNIMNQNSGFFRSRFLPLKKPNNYTHSNVNKYSNEADIIANIEKIFYAKILVDIGRGLTLNHFDKINFTGDGIHFAGKNKNLEYTQKLREDCYYFRHLFGYCVKEKENKTLITPQIFDTIINNYQKIENIENFSNKVKKYLNELSAEKQYNILTDIFIDNELKNKESLQTKKRL